MEPTDHGSGGIFIRTVNPGDLQPPADHCKRSMALTINGSQFGTTTPSTLKWFTGKSDMSWCRLSTSGFIPNNGQTDQAEFEGGNGAFEVDLKNLFKLTPLIGSLAGNSASNGSVPSYLIQQSPQYNGNNAQNS